MTAPEVSRYYLMRCPDTATAESGTLFSVKLTGSAEEAGNLPEQLEEVECMRCGQQHTAEEVSQEVYEEAMPEDDDDELDDEDDALNWGCTPEQWDVEERESAVGPERP